jgi:hypothetical protein
VYWHPLVVNQTTAVMLIWRKLFDLLQDYGIDFDDKDHPVPAFTCLCGSEYCRGSRAKF